MFTKPLFGLCFLLLLWPEPAEAGKLEKTRKRTSHGSWSSEQDDDDDDDDDDDCSLLQALFVGCPSPEERAALAAVAAERARRDAATERAAQDRAALTRGRYFLTYPYAEGRPGTLFRLRLPATSLKAAGCTESDSSCEPDNAPIVACVDERCYQPRQGAAIELPDIATRLRSGQGQIFADFGQDTDGLSRLTLGLHARNNGLLALDTRFTYWRERLEDGSFDGLWLGDGNLHLQLALLPSLTWSIGLGARALLDGQGGSAGVNATTRIEAYPFRPLVLRLEADAGHLGEAPAFEAQGSLGVIWERTELYTGVSSLRISDVAYDSWFVGLNVHL